MESFLEIAVELALAEDFDLILMDMQMPVMDGLQATRVLRQVGCQTPIVALTANAMKQDVAACLDSGCDAFLSKPIELPEFCRTLTRYLAEAPDAFSARADLPPNCTKQQAEFKRLADQFLGGLPGRLENIDAAVDASDWHGVSSQLHNLKGMGGSFGFPQITGAAAAAYAELRRGNQAETLPLLGALRDTIEAIPGFKSDSAA